MEISDDENRVPESSDLPPLSSIGAEATELGEEEACDSPRRILDRVGPYRIIQEIGEGGMGSVYEAEQLEPVRRKVALKVIRAGRDSKSVIARFEAERQALALMDHPSIARIIDAGTTELGQPFFAMELVDGVPLTAYCDDNALSIQDRLALFCQICDGIQHAHQKGIIHRDLKPGNILVTEYDGKPSPKIIDFGLAKALETTPSLTDKSIHTEFGQVLGTIKYMSPEQAGLDALDIDTRTDIYSLGIILYELLTGSTPLDNSSIKENALLKVLELVREQEAPKPSSKLSTDSGRISTISSRRQIEPKKLNSILAGELDWVVMKSLEKDRERRYASANEFAEDVKRYLSQEPILARPPSRSYQLQKFVRKNKGLVASLATIGALLIAGIGGTAWFALGESVARKLAETNEELANSNAKAARESAIVAQQSAKRSMDSLHIFAKAFHSVAPLEGGFVELSAKDALLNAHRELQQSTLDDVGRVSVLAALTVAFLRIGEYDLAVKAGETEVELRAKLNGSDYPDTLVAVSNLAAGYFFDGQADKAIELLEEFLPVFQEVLGSEHPDTLTAMHTLAMSYNSSGDIRKATELSEHVVKSHQGPFDKKQVSVLASANVLAISRFNAGRVTEAIDLLEIVVNGYGDIHGEDHVNTLKVKNDLAVCYSMNGQVGEATKILETVANLRKKLLGDNHPYTLSTLNNLAQCYEKLGRFDKALDLNKSVAERLSATLGEDHPETLTTLGNLALSYRRSGCYRDAVKINRKVLASKRKKLGQDHPSTISTLSNLAIALEKSGDSEEAMELHKEALALRKSKLGADHPDSLQSVNNLAVSYFAMEKTEEAVEMLNELITTKERKFGRNHFTTIKSLVDLATGLKKAGFRRKAVVLFEDVVARRQAALGKDHQLTMVGRIQLADSLFDVDNARAIELLKDVHSKRQSNSPKNWSTFNTQSLLGEAYLKHGDRELATTHLEGAYNKLESVSDEIPQVVRFTRLNDAVERLILLSKTTGDDTKLKKWTDEKKRIANDFGFVDKPNANASEGN